MTLEDIYLITGIMAAIGVVISLIFVGLQIRHNTQATRSAAAQSAHSNFANWYTSVQSDPVILEISVRGLQDYSSLSEIEKAQLVSLFMAFNLHMQDAYYKWLDGSLSPELWRGWELVSQNMFATPGGKAFWVERGYMYGAAYQNFIDTDLMKRAPHSRAKPFGAFALTEQGNTSNQPDAKETTGEAT